MISGLTIISNPEKYKYPWQEAVTSFLPVCDEVVIVYNVYSTDGSQQLVEDFKNKNPKVRVVSGVFDLRKIGWLSYGVMRTTGYQACKGDIVAMFDSDGILHENQVELCKSMLNEMLNQKKAYGFWQKNRIYAPTRYWDQHKHSGWYNKTVLKDDFDFYHPDGRGIPNFDRLAKYGHSVELPVKLFGYEHVWDTKEMMEDRVTNYGYMKALKFGEEIKKPEEYFQAYIDELKEELSKKSKVMRLEDHPAIIQPKLKSLTPEDFGYNFWGMI